MDIRKEAVSELLRKRNNYREANAYYEGDVPETFATAKLRRALRATGERSRLNFCRPVIDAVLNRLEISAVVGTTDRATKRIGEVWEENELDLWYNEIHRSALVYGDCYALVWPDESGDMLISYNSPESTTIVYDPENPRKKLFAAKMWKDGKKTRLNIYTEDKIKKYVADASEVTEGTRFNPAGSVDNPFGEIPVFHFRTMRPWGRPEHRDAYDAQNAVNKLFITNMFTIDYQGAPQRYALSQLGDSEMDDFDEGATERENMGSLQNGPGELWYLKGISNVGEFKPADPAVFWTPIKDTVRSMASLTNTPLHYFEKTGNVPSGEALRVAEAPLVKKVKDRQLSFQSAWRELFIFILAADGIKADVQVKWTEVESLDVPARWDVALKKRNAGLSLAQILREDGYDEEVIERVLEEAKAEREAKLANTFERKPEVRVQPQNDERNAENQNGEE